MPEKKGKVPGFDQTGGLGILPRTGEDVCFGGQFHFLSLTQASSYANQYLVEYRPSGDQDMIVQCQSIDCGSYFTISPNIKEHYCAFCGSRIHIHNLELGLLESLKPASESIHELIHKNISHPFLRAPLMVFNEKVNDVDRSYVVTSQINPFEMRGKLEILQSLRGTALALDHLHLHGFTFDGRIDEDYLGWDEQNLVWYDFANIRSEAFAILGKAKNADIQAFILMVFRWFQTKAVSRDDLEMPSGAKQLFAHGISGGEYDRAFDFTRELLEACGEWFPETETRRVVNYSIGKTTDVGALRTLNEDSILTIFFNQLNQSAGVPCGLYVVADGMGGHAGGEIASGVVVDLLAGITAQTLFRLIKGSIQPMEWLVESIKLVNRKVVEFRNENDNDMGSTVVAAFLMGNQLFLANVGDSRAYLVKDQQIRQLSRDHSVVAKFLEMGKIKEDEIDTHPMRHVIYRSIGDEEEVKVEHYELDLSPGDRLLLCSDGLNGMISDQRILDISMRFSSPQMTSQELTEAAIEAGGEDNISVIVIDLE